jgi:hypothetical protein
MWPVTHDGSVSSQAMDPLKWFPFSTPSPLLDSATRDPGLGAAGLVQGWVRPW